MTENESKGNDDLERSVAQVVDAGAWLSDDRDSLADVHCTELPGGLDASASVGFGIVLENLLSKSECEAIIRKTEELGYGRIGSSKTGAAYRGNRRVQIDDLTGSLAQKLFHRIAPFVPQTIKLPDDDSLWHVEEQANTRFRFAKYGPGQGFAAHIDKPTVYEKDRCSIFTVNIYLNDLQAEQRGRTRFYTKRGGLGQPTVSVGGVAGSCAIFQQAVVDHSPWHDGDLLVSGVKYLMRTDIMYTHKK